MADATESDQAPWTIGRLLQWTTEFFRDRQIDEPRLSAEILLARSLGCERIFLYTRFEEVPGDQALATFRDHVRRAGKHEPIAYLVGHKEFFSLDFEVTPDVLIPRPETETLVERAAEHCRTIRDETVHVLEIGTGSGCAMIALLHQVPSAIGVATDLSPAVLEVARRNAASHNVQNRLTLVKADKMEVLTGVVPHEGFHLMISNPPYIAEPDLQTLPENIRNFEPAIALTPGGDGLNFYRIFAADAPRLLRDDGAMLFEIGAGQRDPILTIFDASAAWRHVDTYRSSNDPHDRVMQFAKV